MIRSALFVLVSAGLVYVSRAALRAPRSHGFWRLFAWEAILGVILLNAPRWFTDPFSLRQVVSWLLLIISIYPAVHGVRLLRQAGRPDPKRDAAGLLDFEKTTALVTTGIYRYIRHPLYASLLFLTWGAMLKDVAWPGVALTLAATGLLALTAKADERECLHFFGPAYEAYMRRTKRFIPFVF